MSQEQFEAAVERELGALVPTLEALEAGLHIDTSDFAYQYRRLCQRLALARHRRYSTTLVQRLNALVVRGHAQLYRRGDGDNIFDRAARLLLVQFPRELRARPKPLLLSTALFLGVGVVVYIAILLRPGLVHAVLSPLQVVNIEQMYDPASHHFLRPRGADSEVAMFAYYIRNNVGIALRTFGAGLAFGIGTMYVLVYNGLVLAAVAAHLQNVGSSDTFWPFVCGHSALELGGIVVAGCAGIRLGMAVVSPGLRSRALAMREEALAVVPLVFGFTAMLLLAALVEAFWSSQHHLGAQTRYIVAALLGSMVALWLWVGGRNAA